MINQSPIAPPPRHLVDSVATTFRAACLLAEKRREILNSQVRLVSRETVTTFDRPIEGHQDVHPPWAYGVPRCGWLGGNHLQGMPLWEVLPPHSGSWNSFVRGHHDRRPRHDLWKVALNAHHATEKL